MSRDSTMSKNGCSTNEQGPDKNQQEHAQVRVSWQEQEPARVSVTMSRDRDSKQGRAETVKMSRDR
jgi:hypothetical protein